VNAGGWLSYAALAGPVNDRLGRRWAGVAGVAVLSLGAALQAGAVHLAMMIVGRFIAGVGTSTAVPLYLSEISPARHRGAILALNQTGIVSNPTLNASVTAKKRILTTNIGIWVSALYVLGGIEDAY